LVDCLSHRNSGLHNTTAMLVKFDAKVRDELKIVETSLKTAKNAIADISKTRDIVFKVYTLV
jgi:hypothetical protein